MDLKNINIDMKNINIESIKAKIQSIENLCNFARLQKRTCCSIMA